MKYLLLALSVCVSACSPISIKDLRSEQPFKTGVFNAKYSELGNCVLESLISSPQSTWKETAGNLQYESTDRKSKGSMIITGSSVSHYKIPIIDMIFYSNGESNWESTVVEVRFGGFQGGPRLGVHNIYSESWLFVEQCSTQH